MYAECQKKRMDLTGFFIYYTQNTVLYYVKTFVMTKIEFISKTRCVYSVIHMYDREVTLVEKSRREYQYRNRSGTNLFELVDNVNEQVATFHLNDKSGHIEITNGLSFDFTLVTQAYFDSLASLTETAVIFKAIPAQFTPRGHEQGIPDDMVYLNFDNIQSPTALMYLKRKGGCYFEGIKYAMRYKIDGIVTFSAIDTIPQAGDRNRNLLPRQLVVIFSMMTGQLTATILPFDEF
jgi:hypothetical protein